MIKEGGKLGCGFVIDERFGKGDRISLNDQKFRNDIGWYIGLRVCDRL